MENKLRLSFRKVENWVKFVWESSLRRKCSWYGTEQW
jgi:hypothetical protein